MTKLLTILISIITTCSVAPTENKNEKVAFGTFTYLGEEGAQFKSYDDEVWWYLEYEDIGEKPQTNKPYALTYNTNGTEECEHTDCDNCWREDDTLIKIEKKS